MRKQSIVFFAGIIAVCLGTAGAAATSGQASLLAADEITYSMPPGWIAQAVQGGPDLKAHFVYMSGGRPYGEMYLSQNPMPQGQTLDQVFEEGLAKIRPQMPYYQARSTQKTTVGGVPAVVHEFSYMPGGAGVMFTGRTYALVTGSTVSTFFFQSVSSNFLSMQNAYAQVMAGVRPAPKPAPAPVNPVPGDVTANPAVINPGGGNTAEDMGLNYDLPAGWRLVDDPMGAKYRFFDAGGSLLASLFVFKPDASAVGLAALFGATNAETLNAALAAKVEDEYKSYQRYAPVATVKRKIAGYDGLVHDFTFLLNNRPAFYRWAVFAVPQKSDNPNVRIAPTIQPFAFLSGEANRAAEFQRMWDAIIDSMRVKGGQAPPVPADKGGRVPPPPPVKDKEEGGLPDLVADAPGPGLYAEPFGRYQVALPEGAVQTKIEDNAAYFLMPGAKTTLVIHSYRQDETGARLAARFAEGRKLNGAPSALTVGGREATISLYTARDDAGESLVWVVALYPKSGLLIVVNLPAKDYAAAKEWISAFVRGVRF